ncbi:CRIB domain-containing protein RIC6 [Argentina anserina]|uniref:CRIB domain-containing protein RIC6 n=1 Tax=Argentina anserina TaxID=57926 RepID=UPI0021766E60|nr:CRIB domain-containing protein RIC6 [Potentilla anserina]
MATKVKGLLKGLRYISQIFEEKDQEIQIGFPTDVKHVAHIGWDGPSANSTPSWMTEFKSPQESAGQLGVKELSAKDINKRGLSIAAQELARLNDIPKSTSSPSKKDGKSKKSSRRNRSTEASGMESPAREGSSRHSRRSRNSTNSLGSESPSHDLPGIPKLRKKKGSTDGGSAKSSRRPRSKGQNSLPDMSLEGSENGSPMHPAFAGKSSEIIPAGIHI